VIGNECDEGCSKKIIIECLQKLNAKESPKGLVFPDIFHGIHLSIFLIVKLFAHMGN
jgi:hypothetical protein